ncbi:putative glucose-6-phosphate 1-epimerase [Senna tora]|uniref:Putative glucose-6-phosphate 1-epimerase n=1 Tax=Senna tora TaxID=362788 RepID=A0A834WT67_9FABA|nr:putative glucose-6-phosphate 1-epimerase [Senna tora]
MFFHGKQNVGKNYYSQVAIFTPPKAVRGGIPIYFSRFGNHGFARNKMWVIEDNPPSLPNVDSNGKSYVDLLLKPSEEDLKLWLHRLKKELQPLEAANVHAILESEPMIDEAQSFNLPTVSFLHQVCFQNFAGIEGMKVWVIYM